MFRPVARRGSVAAAVREGVILAADRPGRPAHFFTSLRMHPEVGGILCRASRRAPSASTRSRAPSLCLAVNTGCQRKTDPDLFRLRKHWLCQRRLMAAIERRHLDLASIGAADSQSSAPAAAQSMYWSSSKSAMVRLLGSTRTWARTVNGTLIQASARRTVGLGASGPLGKLAKT
jgi:hypothetical protein